MSTIIDALKQAERESKNILLKEEDSLFESSEAGESEELETAGFEDKEEQQYDNKSFLSNKFIVFLLFLTAFIGAGAGGWYLYETGETGSLRVNKNIASGRQKIRTAPVVYNVNKKPRIQSNLFDRKVVRKSKPANIKSVSLPKPPPKKRHVKKILKKTNITEVAFGENRKGIQLYGNSEIEKAMDEFLNAIKNKPNMAEAHFNLALVYEDMGKTDYAESEYKKVMSLNSKFIDAYINLGVIYNNQKRYSDAQKIYEEVLEIAPDDPTAHFNLGVLYAYYIKQPIKAIFHWKRYIRIKPESGNLSVIKKEIAKLATT